ncbi:hypothetical protein SELMODRAFT_404190 [Selaginella moellendorffii]|uniref:UDP-3-O-[3-hydroxymyristoyl] glucosamine N-acyltransferase non-repeat region domain-containing protein n=1 Tax=Selaginella moellendorffii TaxID=88036 RepID=D8QUJ6_SELML|nr:hypothetical protein SELMODRAFT_404190 [Selaginella moellendorffii]
MGRLAIQMLAISRRHAVPKIQSAWFAQAPEFERWDRGGGNVHRLARVDPSVVVEIGGVVHAGATIGITWCCKTVRLEIFAPSIAVFAWDKMELRVKIGNSVEIGANSSIDRGSWRDTVIGDNTKLDNLVQIGHNVVIGCNCMICGQVGIAGSCTLGDNVVLGGQAGVADHIEIASKVRIAAKSGVTSNITEPGDYAGFPAVWFLFPV